MKAAIQNVVMGLTLVALLCGCGKFWGGLAGGAVGAGAGYELSARHQLDELDDDLKHGRIDQKEYDIRRAQIERGSLVY